MSTKEVTYRDMPPKSPVRGLAHCQIIELYSIKDLKKNNMHNYLKNRIVAKALLIGGLGGQYSVIITQKK
ncbi:MAG: hypothetical protein R6W78_17035 [Bacteroidales bacterium]